MKFYGHLGAFLAVTWLGLGEAPGQNFEDEPAWEHTGLQARFELARHLMNTGEYAAASQELEFALTQGGDPFAVHTLLSTSYVLAGDLKRAIAHLQAAHAIDPDHPDLLALEGQFELAFGDTRRGEALLERLVMQQPETAEARLLLVRSYLQREEVAQAQPHLDALTALATGRQGTWVKVLRARWCSLQGHYADALGLAAEAFAEEPSMPEAVREWGLALLHVERYGESKPYLERAWADGPQDPQLAFAMGEMCYRSHDWEAAQRYWARGHRMNPLAYPMAQKLAGLYLATGQVDKGESLIGDLRRRFPNRPEGFMLEAYWARKMGKTSEAAHLLDRLHRLSLTEEMRLDVVWERAQVEFESGRHRNCGKLLDQLTERGTWVKEATLLRARMAFYRSEKQEGERLQNLAKGLPVQWPKAGALVAGMVSQAATGLALRQP